jgi:hypothetical protein
MGSYEDSLRTVLTLCRCLLHSSLLSTSFVVRLFSIKTSSSWIPLPSFGIHSRHRARISDVLLVSFVTFPPVGACERKPQFRPYFNGAFSGASVYTVRPPSSKLRSFLLLSSFHAASAYARGP